MKPTVVFDFDGVIHSYRSGWRDIDVIPDPPVPGAFDAIRRFQDAGWETCIFSSRSVSAKGLAAMRKWINFWSIEEHDSVGCGVGWLLEVRFPQHKPAAMISIDDRGLLFDGDWSHYDPVSLKEFQPWYKRHTK